MIPIPANAGVFNCTVEGGRVSELYTAYAEYLERMLDESDDLAVVISDTVPDSANLPVLLEWADLD